ncbi:MAG: signal peptide peptidase SppA [Rhodocyclaceae bacterium]|jgi:protease-4|nr:signal peptide peptidase SppA [Rhodocyclaceae bacterium]
MVEAGKGRIRRLLGGLWGLVDGARRFTVNLVFLLIALFLVVGFFAAQPPMVPQGAALLLAPGGDLVEEASVTSPLSLLREGPDHPETPMAEVLEALTAARTDSRISALVIDTDRLSGAGLAKLQELRDAIAAFRAAGKPVYAWGSRFDQAQYLLASAADEVTLAPDGHVLVRGFARYTTYFKGLLDKLGIKVHVFKVGTWKSFTEPYTRASMSDEDRQATTELLQGVWGEYRQAVAVSRKLPVEALDRYTLDFKNLLAAAGGDGARMALDARLVDALLPRDEWEARLQQRLGLASDGKRYKHVELADYLDALAAQRPHRADKVAMLVAQGAILDGEQPPGAVGGDTLARMIRAVREDDAVKALVLRIDSPGGSAFASEVIRRELALTRKAGKPVVASMSAVAASGGYWIATGADEIWASPGTITGSIGIFALFPEVAEPLARLGLTVDGVETSPLAGALDPRRPLAPEAADALQLGIQHGYASFIQRVAEGRKMSPEAVEAVAQGRVWLGGEAQAKGLVDHLGGLEDALQAAARRAGLGQYEVIRAEAELPFRERLMRHLLDAAAPWLPAVHGMPQGSPFGRVLADLQARGGELLRWNDPDHLYAHCLCGAP